MECAATMVTFGRARICRQFNINLQQNVKKVWILQEGVAHFGGLLAW